MKFKRTNVILIAIASLAFLAASGIVRETTPAKASPTPVSATVTPIAIFNRPSPERSTQVSTCAPNVPGTSRPDEHTRSHTATDASGDQTPVSTTVRVPHSQ